MKNESKNCIVCGERRSDAIGGVILCQLHAAEVWEEIDQLRAEGKPVDAARIAYRLRRAQGQDYIIRDIPADLWQRAKAAAALQGSTLRETVVEALRNIVEAAEGKK